MNDYLLKTSDELIIGDIVFCHGADFRITSIRESQGHNNLDICRPVYVCETECLNPEQFHGPKSWAQEWTIQGNRLARWAVKVKECAA